MNKGQQAPPSKRPAWMIPVVVGGVIVMAIIIAIMIGNSNTSFNPQVTGSPRAEVIEATINHEYVSFEQPVESVFRIRNVGDKPLIILDEPRVELMQGC